MAKPIALISGATAGIGEACARRLAADYQLILCGRRAERLQALQEALPDTNSQLLCFDISQRQGVQEAIASLPDAWQHIDVLINNAGNAHGLDPIQSGNLEDWEMMIDTNIKGLLYLSRAVLPQMVTRKLGHVVNIGSIAGKSVYPNGNVYCATKHAVDAINQAMKIDLNESGIRVSAINPGLVQTEFSAVRFKQDRSRADAVYQGMQALTADDVADIIHFTITRPAHVNILDLTVLPTAQASATQVKRD